MFDEDLSLRHRFLSRDVWMGFYYSWVPLEDVWMGFYHSWVPLERCLDEVLPLMGSSHSTVDVWRDLGQAGARASQATMSELGEPAILA
ncbi:hypothetical protein Syun_009193 [Stephania yunnanensis]|uniref:Uncharacterized protein n=1 Tax=Stephania yunnanensis TaxID=152371 RepID=A0AAP0KG54_9MAGN